MKEDIIQKAAAQFGNGNIVIEAISSGLIHRTFKVQFDSYPYAIVLQCINQRTFSLPENIVQNYVMISGYLENGEAGVKIPALVPTLQHKYFWVDIEDNFWRATRYVQNSYTLPVALNTQEAYRAARCYAEFTQALSGLNSSNLYLIIPEFHNLQLRYQQFEDAISKAGIMRLLRSTHVISELRQRRNLVKFFNGLGNETDYPTRVMHHDCKISNILFDKNTHEVIGPVDLDTVMPGKFFSDLGDMIRSMVCGVDENSTAWEEISVREEFYEAILTGYLEGIGNSLTPKEKENIHYSGLAMIYMQSLRFVTDFLNNDIYYTISYPEQNLNRALNQFILLGQLEAFLYKKYQFNLIGECVNPS